jgi:chitinase
MTRSKQAMIRGLFFGALAYLALGAGGCQLDKPAEAPAAVASKPRPKPDRVVLGYSAAWFDNVYPPEVYDYGVLTHIARSFLTPHADGSITDSPTFWDPKLSELAKKNGVKLLAAIGGGGTSTAEPWLAMARNPAARKKFFDNLEKLVTEHGYDGIDIDWEPSAQTDPDQKTFTEFMQALRPRFPKWIITTALSPSEWSAKHISWKEVAANVDYINVMDYDYAGPWSGHAAHNTNLYPPQDFVDKDGIDIDMHVKNLLGKYGVAPNKLLLGLAFYGLEFSTDKMGQDFRPEERSKGTGINYSAIAPILASKDYKASWDKAAHVPYLERLSGGHTISYDDTRSLTDKIAYAKQKGMSGVMIWNLGGDISGGKPVLLDTVAQNVGAVSEDPPVEYLKKYYETKISEAKTLSQKVVQAQAEYTRLDKSGDNKFADPLRDFIGLGSPRSDRKSLETQIGKAELLVYKLNNRMDEVDKALDALPPSARAGKKVSGDGPTLLISDFEGGGVAHKLGGNWEASFDANKLGTVFKPSPLSPTSQGKGGSKYCLRMYGHYGRNQAPWPYAEMLASLGTADISGYKSLRFAVKGDGKTYDVKLMRAAVRDYAQFRASFTASKEWTTVEVKFDDMKQPDWGHKLSKVWVDVSGISFAPTATFNDEDFDLSIDDVELVK